MRKFEWKFPNPDLTLKKVALAQALNGNQFIANLLVNRNINDSEKAKDFLLSPLSLLHDPYLMKGMERAVQLLEETIEADGTILLYGDYDVDGTTSVALCYRLLKEIAPSSKVEFYIPDRKEGYGIGKTGADYVLQFNPDLLITLDCGITSEAFIDEFVRAGIKVVICDHHEPGSHRPNADAVLDPKQEDCNYPFKELCGVGVAFKMFEAYFMHLDYNKDTLYHHLDYVAVGTTCDIVSLTGENRVLVAHGMHVIKNKPRDCFKQLLGSEFNLGNLTVSDIVFQIGPKINAAGRMNHAKYAVEMMLEDEQINLGDLVQSIQDENTSRRELDKEITEKALWQIQDNSWQDNFSTVVHGTDWHKGVIGIVASRLIENYYKPTVVFTGEGTLSGSVRSVKGLDVYQALDAISDTIIQFGGHAFAAGLTLKEENLPVFRERFEAYVRDHFTPEMECPTLKIDMKVDLQDLNLNIYDKMKRLEPFGPDNQSPILVSENVQIVDLRQIGTGKDHLKLKLKSSNGSSSFDAVAFKKGQLIHELKKVDQVNIAFHLEKNEWRNNVNTQLRILDFDYPG